MWLQQIEGTFRQSLFELDSSKASLSLEEIVNEACREFLLDCVINLEVYWNELENVYLRLHLSSWATFSWLLITVSVVKTEHEFVGDLVEIRNVRSELCITSR